MLGTSAHVFLGESYGIDRKTHTMKANTATPPPVNVIGEEDLAKRQGIGGGAFDAIEIAPDGAVKKNEEVKPPTAPVATPGTVAQKKSPVVPTPKANPSTEKVDLSEKPLTPEAYDWVMDVRSLGTKYSASTYVPIFPIIGEGSDRHLGLSAIAQALGRQLTIEEVRMFVGIDGETAKICSGCGREFTPVWWFQTSPELVAEIRRTKKIEETLSHTMRHFKRGAYYERLELVDGELRWLGQIQIVCGSPLENDAKNRKISLYLGDKRCLTRRFKTVSNECDRPCWGVTSEDMLYLATRFTYEHQCEKKPNRAKLKHERDGGEQTAQPAKAVAQVQPEQVKSGNTKPEPAKTITTPALPKLPDNPIKTGTTPVVAPPNHGGDGKKHDQGKNQGHQKPAPTPYVPKTSGVVTPHKAVPFWEREKTAKTS